MKHPLIRQGEGPAAAHHRITQEREHDRRKIDRLINLATGPATELAARSRLIGTRSPAGDEQRLRGIPVTARGVAGVQPGTRPGDRITA